MTYWVQGLGFILFLPNSGYFHTIVKHLVPATALLDNSGSMDHEHCSLLCTWEVSS